MSRKGAPSAGCRLKRIPRIIQRNSSTNPVLLVNFPLLNFHGDHRLDGISSQLDDQEKCHRRGKGHETKTHRFVEKTSLIPIRLVDQDAETCVNDAKSTQIQCQGEDSLTVANIEKWLKTRTESVSSIDLDGMKSEAEDSFGVDRYLTHDLPHGFLGKDPDVLSMDIDLSDKKLTLEYDPILHDLRSEKLLEACEKDAFVLPSFQLDQLDSLAMTPHDMMVAGEILPSSSDQGTTSVATRPQDKVVNESSANFSPSESERGVHGDESASIVTKSVPEIRGERPSKRIVNVYVEAVGHVNVETNVDDLPVASTVCTRLDGQAIKGKTKLEPRIIKKRQTPLLKSNKNTIQSKKVTHPSHPREGIMAVVAISTDKISNMTQIVINTGREEQIYQGKTSELIEATGNFPQLARIQKSRQEAQVKVAGPSDLAEDKACDGDHDMIISSALEELGIPDKSLLPVTMSLNCKMWICPREDCRRQFNKAYALKVHILSHYGVRPFKCDFKGCTWAFYSEFKLKRHKETHLKRKDYVCEEENCGRRFTTIYNMLAHKKLHARPKKLFCNVPNCQESFQTRRSLELHMRSHDQSHAPYTCKHEGCGKRYYSSNALTSHQRCHSYKEADIKCAWPGCSKMFDKPCRLKAHIRSHTGYKPYFCKYEGCTWAFSSSSKLSRHQKKHTNDRKFVCEVTYCGKAFMRSEHLKEHKLTHKQGTYFQCPCCDAKFAAKSSVYVHVKKYHGDKVPAKIGTSVKHRTNNEKRNEDIETTGEQDASVIWYQADECSAEVGSHDEESGAWLADNPEDESSFRLGDVHPSLPLSSDDQNSNFDISASDSTPDACRKIYSEETLSDAHLLRIHEIPEVAEEKSPLDGEDVEKDATPRSPHSMELGEEDSAEVEELRIGETNFPPTIRRDESDEDVGKERNCARTYITYNEFLRSKVNSDIFNSPVGATDVVLGAAGLVEGLLLPEDLPSVYYQDDIAGSECQVLLLDSGPPESTINLRDLV